MNILLVNQNWFAEELRELGHRVLTYGRTDLMEIQQEKFLTTWSEVKAALPADFVPELLIVHDNSLPVLITELETIDIPSVFYSVDTHHHLSFHKYLGLVFTHLFVAQKDYIPDFADVFVKPHWLPLWASVHMEPEAIKTYGAVFVGTLNPALNPDRVKFFEELKKLVPIDVRTAAFQAIFPRSSIVVNQTVKGDLNFRVFEAMMSGAMLLTEHAGHGLSDLFENNKHLVLYEKGNVQEAAEKISYYLQNPNQALTIGEAGRKLVCEKHLAKHRAQNILDNLSNPTRPVSPGHCFAPIQNFATLSYTLNHSGEKLWSTRAKLEVLRIAQLGLQSRDRPDPVLALDIMKALLGLEPILSKKAVQDLVDDLRQSYPDMTVFHLVKIDQLSNSGNIDLAQALAAGLWDMPAVEVIKHAGEIVRELRQ